MTEAERTSGVARDSARQLNQAIAALMVDAVDQIRRHPETFRHEEVTVDMLDLAADALKVPYVSPEAAVFGVARAGAAIIVELCGRLNIDPEKVMRQYEQAFFLESLRTAPPSAN